MLALAAFPLGERCCFLDPSPDAGAGHTSKLLVGGYDDEALLDELAAEVDVVTYEFENVPAATALHLAAKVPVYPPPRALDAAQDRLVEKRLLEEMGFRVAPYLAADSPKDLLEAGTKLGYPFIAKTRKGGYDGKGQYRLTSEGDLEDAWAELGGVPVLAEGLISFDRELSIIGARSTGGETVFYPLTENTHRDGILRTSLAPALGSEELQSRAEVAAKKVMDELSYVGVLAIELFDKEGELYANEMAPRVHNSGHWTIEGAETSQFENHVRAVLGLPLGATAPRGHAAMVNFIGDLPDRAAVLSVPGAHLHLYGKSARPGRKVGHATVRSEDRAKLLGALERLQKLASRPS
jgi:5-(carboxyamino)imidazole ribonucleotide synthase